MRGHMGHHVLPGNPPVELTLRRSSRARRISLRVSGVDGRVTLTMPNGVPEHTALDFAGSKAAWLRTQLCKQPDIVRLKSGVVLPVEGIEREVTLSTGRRVVEKDNSLLVPGPANTMARRLEAWLKALARDRLASASDHYASKLGKEYSRLSLRDTRSRWGSCSHEGRLMYSWRLILAPPEVLEYVAAHEVAHLKEMNHSETFWSCVLDLYPGYAEPRAWLREHGSTLHRYRFEAE